MNTSPFMLIFRESTPERYKSLSPDQLDQLLGKWNAWYDGLAAVDKVQHGHPLEPAGRIVSAGNAVDGPFAESKEVVGGYFLVNAADLEEATEIAKMCPMLEYGMLVEVRPVATGCHLAKSLGRSSMREPARDLASK